MRLQEAKSQVKLQEWRELVYECRNSGQTIKRWCAEHGISEGTYYAGQKRVWDAEAIQLCTGVPKPVALTAGNEDRTVIAAPLFSEISLVPPKAIDYQPVSEPITANETETSMSSNSAPDPAPSIVVRKGKFTLEVRNDVNLALLQLVLDARLFN